MIFGINNMVIEREHVESTFTCPGCGNNQYEPIGYQNYFHLFWIPTLLIGRSLTIHCTKCNRSILKKEMPGEVYRLFRRSIFNLLNTLSMFSGLFIIACIIGVSIFFSHQTDLKEEEYIEAPAENDFYIVDFSQVYEDFDPDYKYGSMRIEIISENTVYFKVGKVVYNLASGIEDDIDEDKTSSDDYYESELVEFEKDELKAMQEAGAIYSIKRE